MGQCRALTTEAEQKCRHAVRYQSLYAQVEADCGSRSGLAGSVYGRAAFTAADRPQSPAIGVAPGRVRYLRVGAAVTNYCGLPALNLTPTPVTQIPFC
ncbi:hypothetical protein J6590_042521 [Homalodisca vitripennis]|nr:hypothetical protein J6590_042521 [Homalodisca vitripennis]